MSKPNVRLGLCSINTELQKKKIFCSRTMIRKNFTVDKAKDLAIQNIKDIVKLMEWNEKNGIKHLRISSDLFPHYTDSECEKYTMDFAKDDLKIVGDWAKKHGHRLTTHPGQYVQLGAKSQEVLDKSIEDLKMHADFLDYMGMDNNSILCIHGGGVYGDKEATMRRWVEHFDDLPKNVKSRLAIENCERSYCVADCLDISIDTGIPVIYDSHHYSCYSCLHPDVEQEPIEEIIDEVVESWDSKGGKRTPLFHISEQAPDKRVGAHSDFISKVPQHIFDISKSMNTQIDVEVEAKLKEQAIMKLYDVHPDCKW